MRVCPTCDNIITYKSKYDEIKGAQNNSVCKECANKKCSQTKKGKSKLDHWIAKGIDKQVAIQMYEQSEAQRLQTRKGYRHSEETKLKISQTEKGKIVSQETKDKISRAKVEFFKDPIQREKVSKIRLSIIQQRPELEQQRFDSIAKTIALKEQLGLHINGFCTYFQIGGLKCQGNWERMFIERLISENSLLPVKPTSIKTELGYYTPDFEFEEYYVEIKSTFTLDICLGNRKGLNGKMSDLQFSKIEWVGKNIKPVHIYVLDRKGNKIETIIIK